jgi:hypothetical protein
MSRFLCSQPQSLDHILSDRNLPTAKILQPDLAPQEGLFVTSASINRLVREDLQQKVLEAMIVSGTESVEDGITRDEEVSLEQ